jgi:hypothetical protein
LAAVLLDHRVKEAFMPDEIPVPPPADPIPQHHPPFPPPVVPPDDPNRPRTDRTPDIDPPPARPPVDDPATGNDEKRLM